MLEHLIHITRMSVWVEGPQGATLITVVMPYDMRDPVRRKVFFADFDLDLSPYVSVCQSASELITLIQRTSENSLRSTPCPNPTRPGEGS